jgi:hypothetical protein
MLRLPLPNYRITSRCTFSCAQTLFSLVGGASTMLYAHRDSSPGKDFKDLLVDFYPWADEPASRPTPSEAARIMYEQFRNPLAHNIGAHVRRRPSTPRVKIKRVRRSGSEAGPTERFIEQLERGPRPNLSPAVIVRPGDATVLFVEPLYWGIRIMLKKLLEDSQRMIGAEAYLTTVV